MRSRPGPNPALAQFAGSCSPDPSELPPRAILRLPVRRDAEPSEPGDPMPHAGSRAFHTVSGTRECVRPHRTGEGGLRFVLGRWVSAGSAANLKHPGWREEAKAPPQQALSPEFILETEAPALGE